MSTVKIKMKVTMNKRPIAVLTADVHFNITTLPLATKAMEQIIEHAHKLRVPLIVAGDLHDTKANMQAACTEELLNLNWPKTYLLRGNHDQRNEKSKKHALNFLQYKCDIITEAFLESMPPTDITIEEGVYFIPYQYDPLEFEKILSSIPLKSIVIMHQGVKDANAGDYIQDKSAVDKSLLANYRCISGHYHTRQDIKCGRPRQNQVGLFSYIGNPYSLTFGEANDPIKGFRILYDDGTLDFIPTNLRRHYIFNVEIVNNDYQVTGNYPLEDVKSEDLVWLKVKGTKEEINKIDKQKMLKSLNLNKNNVKIDLMPIDTVTIHNDTPQKNISQSDTIDGIINDLSNTTEEHKLRLKSLWRNLCE